MVWGLTETGSPKKILAMAHILLLWILIIIIVIVIIIIIVKGENKTTFFRITYFLFDREDCTENS